MSLSGMYIDTFDVQEKAAGQDAVGGASGAWSDLSTGNAGRIVAHGGNEIQVGGKETVISTHLLYCDTSVTISEVNRVVCDSKTYDVLFVDTADDYSAAHHKEVEMKLRE